MRSVEIPSALIEKLARAMCLGSGQDPDMAISFCPSQQVSIPGGGVGYLVPRPEHCAPVWSSYEPAAEAALMVLGEVLQLQFTVVDAKAS